MLTERFGEALAFAERLHRDQRRNGNDVPYIAHLLAVCAIVLEWHGDEETAIAALLHDAVEDQGGLPTAELIRELFGERVVSMVLHCTDSVATAPSRRLPWLQRKTAYLERLVDADAGSALITVADKLHNLTATIRDVRAYGPQTLQRFTVPDRLLWYYEAVAVAMEPYAARAPVAELWSRIAEFADLVTLARD